MGRFRRREKERSRCMRTRSKALFSGQWKQAFWIVLSLVLLALAGQRTGWAQAITGEIVGTVMDSTGAVVPNARIVITNTGTQEKRQTKSGGAGEYTFSLLQPGMYTLVCDAATFKTYKLSPFSIGAGDRIRLDVQLQLGAASETVEVRSDSVSALQADS